MEVPSLLSPANQSPNKPLFGGGPDSFGYTCLGPFVAGFCQWTHTKKRSIEAPRGAALLFVARDCKLIHQAYLELFPEEVGKSHYVLGSRSAFADTGPEAKTHREAYRNYLLERVAERDAIVVDVGYLGTAQRYFAGLLKRTVAGLYILTHRGVGRVGGSAGPVFAYAGHDLAPHTDHNVLNANRYFLEALLSDEAGRFVRFSGPEQPEFEPPGSDARTQTVRRRIHEGALRFVKECRAQTRKGEPLAMANLDPNLLVGFLQRPHPDDAALFAGFGFEDAMSGHAHRHIVAPDAERAASYALWVAGQDAIDRHKGRGPNLWFRAERQIARRRFSTTRFTRFATNRRLFMADMKSPLWRLYARLTSHVSKL